MAILHMVYITEMTGNEGRDKWGMACNNAPRPNLNVDMVVHDCHLIDQ